jgi:hypothetical protein
MVMYHEDGAGRCTPRYVESENVENIHAYYLQRSLEMKRLHEEVVAGSISPVAFFVQYQHMDVKDVAARVKLRPGTVRKHMTLRGFSKARVEELQRYARVFDISVSDLFDFTFVDEAITVESSRFHNRLIHQAKFTATPPKDGDGASGGLKSNEQ